MDIGTIFSGEHVAKYLLMVLLGSSNKIYDDLIDLYFIDTREHVTIFLQCIQNVLVCFWLFVLATNKYDAFVIIIMCSYCLFDWDAYVSDPYFCITTFLFIGMSIATIIARGWAFTTYELAAAYFVGIFLTTAVTEKFCINTNGFYHQIMRRIHNKPDEERFINKYNITATTLEVSYYKVKVRTVSILYLFALLCLMFYLIGQVEPHGMWHDLLYACSYFNLGFIAYYLTSIFNQLNVLYNHPEIVEKHKEINQDSDPPHHDVSP